MRAVILILMVFVVGCVPFPIYTNLEKSLSASKAERNTMTKKLDACEGKNKRLRELPKPAPAMLPVKPIGQTELDEIKKKAFEEADQKYKARVIRENLKK